MTELGLENITSTVTLNYRINVKASQINTDIDKNILSILQNQFEGKFLKEGYLEKDTIVVIDTSYLETELTRFKGDVKVNVSFSAKVINPLKDSIITCEIKKINNFGIMAIAGPLNILIPSDDIDKFKVNDVITVKIIKPTLVLNEGMINIYAVLYTKSEQKKLKVKTEKSDKLEKAIPSDDESDDGDDDAIAIDIGNEEDDEEEPVDDEEIAAREVDIDEEDDEEEDDEEDENNQEESKKSKKEKEEEDE